VETEAFERGGVVLFELGDAFGLEPERAVGRRCQR
jgi:hypothetical protein